MGRAVTSLEAVGLHDVVRERWLSERVFTYWDYRAGMFHQDLGMRIDLVLAGAPDGDIGPVVPPPSAPAARGRPVKLPQSP